MNLVSLILLLVVFSGLAVMVDRRIQERKRQHVTAVDKTSERFARWAQVTFADNARLQQWLASLPPEATSALAGRLADYCHDLGFQLDWVMTGGVAQELTPSLRRIAAQYVKSCFEAYQSQDDVRCLSAWLDYNQQPSGKEQQVLGQHLLAQLIAAGIVSQSARTLLTAQDGESASKIHAALSTAAEQNPAALRMALKTVLVGPLAAPAQAGATNGQVAPAMKAAAGAPK